MKRSTNRRLVFPDALVLTLSAAIFVGATGAAVGEGYRRVAETGVSVAVPADFEPLQGFKGFGNPSAKVSVVVLELPMAYAKFSKFVKDDIARADTVGIVSSEEVKIDGRPAYLLKRKQEVQGQSVIKWVGIFSDETTTVQVMANIPSDLDGKWSGPLREVVLGARWDPAATPSDAKERRAGGQPPRAGEPHQIFKEAWGGKVCQLVTTDELRSVLGGTFDPGVEGSARNQTTCKFPSKTVGAVGVSLFVPSPMDADARWTGMKENMKKALGDVESVPGVGDDAVYVTKMATLFVRVDDEVV